MSHRLFSGDADADAFSSRRRRSHSNIDISKGKCYYDRVLIASAIAASEVASFRGRIFLFAEAGQIMMAASSSAARWSHDRASHNPTESTAARPPQARANFTGSPPFSQNGGTWPESNRPAPGYGCPSPRPRPSVSPRGKKRSAKIGIFLLSRGLRLARGGSAHSPRADRVVLRFRVSRFMRRDPRY